MKGLWERVIQEADAKLEKAASEFQEIISTLRDESDKYKTNNQKWQKLHDQWVHEREKLQADLAMKNEQNQTLKQQYNTLGRRRLSSSRTRNLASLS